MGQQQFKVRFPVGTKLLISVVLLLLIAIAFLDVSTILLLEKDKKAYTYQAQSTESVLVGREFTNTVRHALDTLRLTLASIDPDKEVAPQQQAALQSVMDNQSEVVAVTLEMVDPKSGLGKPLAQAAKSDLLKEVEVSQADLEIPAELRKDGIESLKKEGLLLTNASKVGKTPLLGIVLADLKFKERAEGMPVAIGYISLKSWGKDMGSSNLSVATREGWVLFDTDTAALYAKKNIADDPLFAAGAASQLSSGAQEFEAEGTRYLGSFVLPGFNLVVLSRTEWRKAMAATYALTEKFILLGLMAIGAAIIFALFFSKTISAPINILYEATREVSKGNFNIALKPGSRDEIGALTGSFNAMSAKIGELIEESMKKVHLENELAIASTVQQTLIPPAGFRNDWIDIRSHYQSAAECGGDWWGFFGVGKRMCLMIADATGHGLPSALITASARSCFSVMHKLAQEDPEFSYSPGAMLSYANRVVHDAAGGRIMMTFFVASIDFEKKTLTYSSAGHNPPWLFHKGTGKFALKSLTSSSMRLGEVRDVANFEEKTVEFGAGDILMLYTDGLMEGKNKEGAQYGKKRVKRVVESNLSAGPDAVIKALVGDFLQYNAGKTLDDDLTLAIAKLLPEGPSGSA